MAIDSQKLWINYVTGKTPLEKMSDEEKSSVLRHGISIGAIDGNQFNFKTQKKYGISDIVKPEPIVWSKPEPPKEKGLFGKAMDSIKNIGNFAMNVDTKDAFKSNYTTGLSDSIKKYTTPKTGLELSRPNNPELPDFTINNKYTPTMDSNIFKTQTGIKAANIKPNFNILDTFKKNLPSDSGGASYDDAKELRAEHFKIKNENKYVPSTPSYDIKGKPIVKPFSSGLNIPSIKTTKSDPIKLDVKRETTNTYQPAIQNIGGMKADKYLQDAAKPYRSTKPTGDGFVESLVEGFESGLYNVKLGREGFKEIARKENEFTRIADEYDKRLDLQPKEGTGMFNKAVRGVTSQIPMWISAEFEGVIGAFAGAGAAAGLGNAGPQALIAEEVFTVPGATALGHQVGRTVGYAKIMAGLDYKEMIDRGISPDAAKLAATTTGTINSLIEQSQLGKIIKNAPGGEKILKKLFKDSGTEALTEVTQKYGTKFLKDKAKDLSEEIGQEMVQEVVTIYGINAATKLHNMSGNPQLEYIATKQAFDRVLETGIDSALTFGLMFTPGTITQAAGMGANTIARHKQSVQLQTSIDYLNYAAENYPKMMENIDVTERYVMLRSIIEKGIDNVPDQQIKANIKSSLLNFESTRTAYLKGLPASSLISIIGAERRAEQEVNNILPTLTDSIVKGKENTPKISVTTPENPNPINNLDGTMAEVRTPALETEINQAGDLEGINFGAKRRMDIASPPLQKQEIVNPANQELGPEPVFQDMPDNISDTVSNNDIQGTNIDINNDVKTPQTSIEGISQTSLDENNANIPQDIKPADMELPQAQKGSDKIKYLGTKDDVILGKGNTIKTGYALVDVNDLIASNIDDGMMSVNPNYPKELQPRDRSRDASKQQIEDIAQNLVPQWLGKSNASEKGAPIIGNDLIVESGNGRILALQKIFNDPRYAKSKQDYLDYLSNDEEGLDIPFDIPENHILVRVRESDVDRAEFTAKANEQTVAGMSSSEMARSDANKITPGMFEGYDASLGINSAGNKNFVEDFISKVISRNEQAQYVTKDGSLAELGIRRIENALLYKAFENDKILQLHAEETDVNIKNILSAMVQNSPQIIKVKEAIKTGDLFSLDISEDFARAAVDFAEMRQQKIDVTLWLNQINMFSDTPKTVAEFINLFNDNSKKKAVIVEYLRSYYQGIESLGNPNQLSFGQKNEDVTVAGLLDAVTKGENNEQIEISKTNEERETDSGENTEQEQDVAKNATSETDKDGPEQGTKQDSEVDSETEIAPIKFMDYPPSKMSDMTELDSREDKGYAYNRIKFYEKDDNLYLRFTGKTMKPKFMEIENYKNKTPQEIFQYLIENDMEQGRHFEDGIRKIWKDKGLGLGYTEKTLRPIGDINNTKNSKAESNDETVEATDGPEIKQEIDEDQIYYRGEMQLSESGEKSNILQQKDLLSDVLGKTPQKLFDEYSKRVVELKGLLEEKGNNYDKERLKTDLSIAQDSLDKVTKEIEFQKIREEASKLPVIYMTSQLDTAQNYANQAKEIAKKLGNKSELYGDIGNLQESIIRSFKFDKSKKMIDLTKYGKNGIIDTREIEEILLNEFKIEKDEAILMTESLINESYFYDSYEDELPILALFRDKSLLELFEKVKGEIDVVRYTEGADDNYVVFNKDIIIELDKDGNPISKEKKEVPQDVQVEKINQATLADYGLAIEQTKTKAGKDVWNVTGNTWPVKKYLSKAGGEWVSFLKAWAYYQTENPTQAILKELPEIKVNRESGNNDGRANNENEQGTNAGTNTRTAKPSEVDVEMEQEPLQEPAKDRDTDGIFGNETTDGRPDGGNIRKLPQTRDNETDVDKGNRSDNADISSDARDGDIQGASDEGIETTSGRGSSERGVNFKYTDELISELKKRKPKQIAEDNIAALELLETLGSSMATAEQQAILARFSGWGGLKDAMVSEAYGGYPGTLSRLAKIYSISEINNIKANLVDSFYTPAPIVKAIYSITEKLGFEHGRILEPSSGSGFFIGNMPSSMRNNSTINMTELDERIARLSQKLYPKTSVFAAGFETVKYPNNHYNLVVGNVPFGDTTIKYGKNNLYIHDYFINKSLDLLNPGGIMAVITSTGTLDKENELARRLMYEKADLVAAYRLPSNIFEGTSVNSDLLIFKKRGVSDIKGDNTWLNSSSENDFNRPLNEYFINNKDNILGDMKLTSGRFGVQIGVMSDLSVSHTAQILVKRAESLEKIYEQFSGIKNQITAEEINIRQGEIVLKEGKAFQRKDDQLIEIARTASEIAIIKDALPLAEKLNESLNLRQDPQAMKKSLKVLEKMYDAFVKKHGNVSDSKIQKTLDGDFTAFKLLSLELSDGVEIGKKGKKTKNYKKNTELFSGENIGTTRELESTDSPKKAVFSVLGKYGEIRLDEIAKLLGTDKENVMPLIEDFVFESPDGSIVPADEYLSGPVRTKYYEAKFAAKQDKKYEKNVAALKKVIPESKDITNIDFKISSSFIPESVIISFLHDTFGETYGFTYSPLLSRWNNNYTGSIKRGSKFQPLGNTTMVNFIDSVLNERNIIFKNRDKSINIELTTDAALKAQMLRDEFKSWVMQERNREIQHKMENAYNEKFRNNVPLEIDPDNVEIPDMNPNIKLRGIQKIGISRALRKGNTLLALDVGLGKTFSLIAISKEFRRLGRSNKPLFVVPKNKIGDFVSDYKIMYPTADILFIPEGSSKADKAKLYAQATASSGFDAFIISSENLKEIPISREREIAYIQKQIDDAVLALEQAKGLNDSDNNMSKKIGTLVKNLNVKLTALQNTKTADTFTFEQMGIDSMFVDEAHKYKNLYFNSRFGNVKGVSVSSAGRATSMQMKTEYINEISGYKNVVFATATPMSNSLSEMYNMMRYLMPQKLAEMNVKTFDEWVTSFGRIENVIRLNYNQEGFKEAKSFMGLSNSYDAVKMFKEVAYQVDARSEPSIILPEVNNVEVEIEVNPQTEQYMEYLSDRVENLDPKTDSHLAIYGEAKHSAVDMRFVRGIYEELTGQPLDTTKPNKMSMSAENIYNKYKETEANKGTQLVFIDMGVEGSNAKKFTFEFYAELKKALLDKGIAAKDIAFISEWDKNKDELYRKVNAGEIRVLIGSTSKMGEGVNVQTRVAAIHHLSVPHRPADIIQANGRAIRFGNMNKSVDIFYYIDKGSFDAIAWGMIREKAVKLTEAMYGDLDVKDIDTSAIDMSAVLQANAVKNPLAQERLTLVQKMIELKREREIFNMNKRQDEFTVKRIEESINDNRVQIKRKKELIEIFKDFALKLKDKESKYDIQIKVRDKVKKFDNLKDGFKEIQIVAGSIFGDGTEIIGTIDGLNITINNIADKGNMTFDKQIFIGKKTANIIFDFSNSEVGNITKLTNRVEALPEDVIKLGEFTKELEIKKTEAIENQKARFTKDEEIEDVENRLIEIDTELGLFQSEKDDRVEIVSVDDLGEESDDEIKYDDDGNEIEGKKKIKSQAYIRDGSEYAYQENSEQEYDGDYEPQDPKVGFRARVLSKQKNKVASPYEVVRSIKDKFNLPVSHQRFSKGKKTLGYYNPNSFAIKVRDYGAFDVIIHELGHHIDNINGLSELLDSEKFIKFVNKVNPGFLDNYKEDLHFSEALAEFLSNYILNNEKMMREHEDLVSDFEEAISRDHLKKLTEIRQLAESYIFAEKKERLKATMHSYTDTDKVTSKEKWMAKTAVIINISDDLARIREFAEAAGISVKEAAKNPYILALHSRTADGITDHIINRALVDSTGIEVGVSLKEIFSLVSNKDFNDFNLYMKLLHASTTEKQVFSEAEYKNDFMGKMKMREEIEMLEKEHPDFKATHERMMSWWKDFMRVWMLDTGLVSEKAMETMLTMYPNYVPSFRKIESNNLLMKFTNFMMGKGGAGGTGFTDQQASKRFKGSSLDTYLPMENMLVAASSVVSASMKNNVMQAMIEAVKGDNAGLSSFFEIVDPAKMKQEFSMTNKKFQLIKKMLIAEGVSEGSLKEVYTIDGLLDIARSMDKLSIEIVDEVIQDTLTQYIPVSQENGMFATAMVDGEQVHMQIHDSMLLHSLKGMDAQNVGWVLGILGSVKRAMTIMITGANPIFGVTSNIWSDVQQALFYGSQGNAAKHLAGVGKSMYEIGINRHGEANMGYRAMGGQFMASKISTGKPKSIKSVIDSTIKGKGVKKGLLFGTLNKFARGAKKTLDVIETFNEAIESAPRLSEYRNHSLDTYNDRLYAWYESQEVTTNFLRKGTINQTLGQGIPFFNAGIQGLSKIVRMLRSENEKPMLVGRVIKGLAYYTMLGILQEAAYGDDDDYKEIPDGVKDSYWLIKKDDGTFLRIRKPREIGFVFASIPQRIIRDMKGDPEAWNDFTTSIKTIFLPPMRTIFAPINDARRNKTWADTPIESRGLENKLVEERYDDGTSEIAKAIGKQFKVSPKKADYIMKQYSGGLGQVVLPMFTESKGLEGTLEGIKRKMEIDPLYTNKSTNDFYENQEKLVQANELFKDKNIKSEYYNDSLRKEFARQAKEMNETRKLIKKTEINENIPKEKREELIRKHRQKLIDIAKRSNKKFDSIIKKDRD